MDVTKANTGSIPAGPPIGGPKADAPKAAKADTPEHVKVEFEQVPKTADEARFREVKAAAKAVKEQSFVVSDTRFTIFKDFNGDYVTKFTSLRDGSVKYFPEKTLFEIVAARKAHAAEVAIFSATI